MRPSHFAEFQAFVAIAEVRSFRHAGARLGLTAATLSHSLRAREERLDVLLLVRTTRMVAPRRPVCCCSQSSGPPSSRWRRQWKG